MRSKYNCITVESNEKHLKTSNKSQKSKITLNIFLTLSWEKGHTQLINIMKILFVNSAESLEGKILICTFLCKEENKSIVTRTK